MTQRVRDSVLIILCAAAIAAFLLFARPANGIVIAEGAKGDAIYIWTEEEMQKVDTAIGAMKREIERLKASEAAYEAELKQLRRKCT